MEQIKALINKLIDQTAISYDRLPDIDLYMDQVIEYLSRQSVSSRENDKISSAMINKGLPLCTICSSKGRIS